jgi:hypothetical protein
MFRCHQSLCLCVPGLVVLDNAFGGERENKGRKNSVVMKFKHVFVHVVSILLGLPFWGKQSPKAQAPSGARANAAEHRGTVTALCPKFYFGASEATIASKRGSPRSGSQSGLRRK